MTKLKIEIDTTLLHLLSLNDLINYSYIEPSALTEQINDMQLDFEDDLETLNNDYEDLEESIEDIKEQANIVLEFMSNKVKENKTSVTFKNKDYEELTKDINDIWKLAR